MAYRLDRIRPGEHVMLVYPNLKVFRQVYSEIAKKRLREKCAVVLMPFYESADSVRNELAKRGLSEPGKFEKDGQLIIADASRVHIEHDSALSFVQRIGEHAEEYGFRNVLLMGSSAPFTNAHKIDELLRFESVDLPASLTKSFSCICCYHDNDYGFFFTTEQQIALQSAHSKQFIIAETSAINSASAV